jgi:hypothetical protein
MVWASPTPFLLNMVSVGMNRAKWDDVKDKMVQAITSPFFMVSVGTEQSKEQLVKVFLRLVSREMTENH